MNVKILFFPLSVTIALAMSVFYIKPEFDTAMTNRGALAEKESLASDIEQKIQNVHELESNLDTNGESETAVDRYLPNTRDDDRIVDSINFLASQAGLALTSLKIERAIEPQADLSSVPEEAASGSAALFASNPDISAVRQAPVVAATPKVLVVSMAAIGSYESIRDAVGKISHMDRFQNFAVVSIDLPTAAAQATDGEGAAASSDTLNATMSIRFTYLPKVNAKGNFNSPILAESAFDFGAVQKLKQYTSTTVPSIEVGTAGVSNPFLR
ncbi:MAG: hypothetical protein PHT88_04970 [Candidatus Moranbacteria bacterium]|nr:hypothetical protein [Candidatus Moranbacteria bacterium]